MYIIATKWVLGIRRFTNNVFTIYKGAIDDGNLFSIFQKMCRYFNVLIYKNESNLSQKHLEILPVF